MNEANWSSELARLLQWEGCPPREVARLMEELKDHRADLKAEGLERELSETEAEAYASRRLGSPEVLARHFVRTRRCLDWWGRHPGLLFGVAPLGVFLLSFCGAALWLSFLGGLCGWWDEPSGLTESLWLELTLVVRLFHVSMMLLIPLLACRVAGHYYYGWTWALGACLVMAFHGCFHDFRVTFPLFGEPGLVMWSYGIPPRLGANLGMALLPLLVFAFHYQRHYRGHPWARKEEGPALPPPCRAL